MADAVDTNETVAAFGDTEPREDLSAERLVVEDALPLGLRAADALELEDALPLAL